MEPRNSSNIGIIFDQLNFAVARGCQCEFPIAALLGTLTEKPAAPKASSTFSLADNGCHAGPKMRKAFPLPPRGEFQPCMKLCTVGKSVLLSIHMLAEVQARSNVKLLSWRRSGERVG